MLQVTPSSTDRVTQQIQSKLGNYEHVRHLLDEPKRLIGVDQHAAALAAAAAAAAAREGGSSRGGSQPSEFKKPSSASAASSTVHNGRTHHHPNSRYSKPDSGKQPYAPPPRLTASGGLLPTPAGSSSQHPQPLARSNGALTKPSAGPHLLPSQNNRISQVAKTLPKLEDPSVSNLHTIPWLLLVGTALILGAELHTQISGFLQTRLILDCPPLTYR